MIRFFPSMTTTVSSDSEIGLKYGYNPAALASSALVNFRHLSSNAWDCRVWLSTGELPAWSGRTVGRVPGGRHNGRGKSRPRADLGQDWNTPRIGGGDVRHTPSRRRRCIFRT